MLDRKAASVGEVLAAFSESAENVGATAAQLAGGIDYIDPYFHYAPPAVPAQ